MRHAQKKNKPLSRDKAINKIKNDSVTETIRHF